MKNPLGYQTTEYDCGPTTVTNAISYLFNREEIPPDVIKHIFLYCLDLYNDKGEFAKNGTSGMAMLFLSNWLNKFGKVKNFPIQCEFITGREVHIGEDSKIVSGLRQGGAVIVRLWYGGWHYALLTDVDESNIYLFDPYFRKRDFNNDKIKMIWNSPTKMNRKIAYELLNSEGKNSYALGPKDTREAILMFKRSSKIAHCIEYYL